MRRTIPALAVALCAATLASADIIRTKAGIGYPGKITGMDAQGLVLDAAGGRQTIPLSDIDDLKVDACPDLEVAGRAYDAGMRGGDDAKDALAQAQRRYEDILGRVTTPAWMRLFIRSRLVRLYTDSNHLRQAMDAYLALAREGADLVAGVSLPRPTPGADTENRAILKRVDTALATAGDAPYAAELKKLRVALIMEVGSPQQKLSLLDQAIEGGNERTRTWARLQALSLLIDLKRTDEAEARLKEAEGQLDPEYVPELTFHRGRVLALKGENLQAAIELMRLPILYPTKDRAMTAQALFLAGQAMEAAGLPDDETRKVYQEAVRDYDGTVAARQARAALARLGT